MNTDKVNLNVPETMGHSFNSETHLQFILLHINTKYHFGHTEVILSNRQDYFGLTNMTIFG